MDNDFKLHDDGLRIGKRKARFVGDLVLIHRNEPVNKKWFTTFMPFAYISKDGTYYNVPVGIDTDFASIPRVFRRIISRTGRHDKAAVLHDYLCEYKIVSRKKADMIFLEAMETLKVNWFKRKIMYKAVRTYSIATLKK